MVLGNKLNYLKVIRFSRCCSYCFDGLEKNIDGQVLMKLTDDDISQLFYAVNEDGTTHEATIGAKSRFRTKLLEWRMKKHDDE